MRYVDKMQDKTSDFLTIFLMNIAKASSCYFSVNIIASKNKKFMCFDTYQGTDCLNTPSE